jgi:hypothetical protein
MRGMDQPHWRGVEPSATDPLQFGIRDLLIAQTVCALCLGLLVMFGVFAVIAIFVGTLIFCALPVRPENVRLKRFVVDLMGGIILPSLGIAYIVGFDGPAVAYITIAVQMLALLIWLIIGSVLGRTKAVFAGTLWVGAMISGIVAVPLFFLGVVGLMFYGIGLLGFTPLLTCYAFLGNMDDARRQAHRIQHKWAVRILFLFGVILAATIPILIYWTLGPRIENLLRFAPRPRGWWDGNFFRMVL